ncbi:carbohydrate deacetylase [Wenzhouxiangella marina]|uniref:Uncharacterized protein n=1 Tax=Wenzhouxiangella marina TaxID=1579979 RepID=A0A0K0XYQ0_9GAMM|nr:ChbG/HpnK family deacetylase [Wenzhouxiangella marina]AKS42751.1 hypothetical protein WM2015_2389 [Wenzhouxiangella marina]MBB6087573.1 putative glycoside hydrolase/deacetylase ChbG (UPF0249 family) [Wenzhouxiangella marina]
MSLLIVNADDFGLNESSNLGIIDCYERNALTSATLIANGSAFDQAVSLSAENPGLGVGLHFNLTWGRPISQAASVHSLVNRDGEFRDRKSLLARAALGMVNALHIEKELHAQYQRLLDAGIQPTHIDSHQHVHGSPAIFGVVARFCEGKQLGLRVPWVSKGPTRSPARSLRRAVLKRMIDSATRPWRGKLKWNDQIISVFDLPRIPEVLTDEHYRGLLGGLDGRVYELMVHPVRSAARMRGFTSIGEIAEAEYRYLVQGTLRAIAKEYGFKLGTYRDIH